MDSPGGFELFPGPASNMFATEKMEAEAEKDRLVKHVSDEFTSRIR